MSNLLVHQEVFRDRTESFGCEFLSFESRKLAQGRTYQGETGGNELAIVVLGGVCSVNTERGEWPRIGRRASVFDGLPYTLYLPIATGFAIFADTDCDLAFCYCRAEEQHPPGSGVARSSTHRDSRRRQRDPPDSPYSDPGISCASFAGCGGFYARPKLVQLSSA
jgi:5-deoxy-D-glucuronate isomerase